MTNAKHQKSKLDKTLPNVQEWADDAAHPERNLFAKRNNDVDEYIQGRIELLYIPPDFYALGMAETGLSLLAAKAGEKLKANTHMAFGFIRKIYAEGIDILRLKGTRRTIVDNLDGATHLMLCGLAMGQPDLVKKFHRVVFDGLAGGYGVKSGKDYSGPETLRYAAMGLSIINEWLELPLDLDALGLPRDPAWGLLVSHWREPNPDALLPILIAACDVHVERIALTEKEVWDGKLEFGSEFEAVHPTEILAVLRLRDLLGLPNPFIDHPLMSTPYAAITCTPGSVTERDTLIDSFIAAAHKRDPHIMANWDRE